MYRYNAHPNLFQCTQTMANKIFSTEINFLNFFSMHLISDDNVNRKGNFCNLVSESSYGVWNRTAVVIDMNESLSRQQIRGANDDDGSDSEDSSQGSKGGSDDDHEEEDLGSIPQGPVTCIILPFNDCLKSVADAAQVVDVAWCSIAHQIFIISIISRKILVSRKDSQVFFTRKLLSALFQFPALLVKLQKKAVQKLCTRQCAYKKCCKIVHAGTF